MYFNHDEQVIDWTVVLLYVVLLVLAGLHIVYAHVFVFHLWQSIPLRNERKTKFELNTFIITTFNYCSLRQSVFSG
jgi:hypothetical protein